MKSFLTVSIQDRVPERSERKVPIYIVILTKLKMLKINLKNKGGGGTRFWEESLILMSKSGIPSPPTKRRQLRGKDSNIKPL